MADAGVEPYTATTTDDDNLARERAIQYSQQRCASPLKHQRRTSPSKLSSSYRARTRSGDAPDMASSFENNINQSSPTTHEHRSSPMTENNKNCHWTRPSLTNFSYYQLGAQILRESGRQHGCWRGSNNVVSRASIDYGQAAAAGAASAASMNNKLMLGPEMMRRRAKENKQTLDKILSTSVIMAFGATASAGAAAMNATLSDNDRNRIEIAKAVADMALRESKVFRIMGNYPPIRRALRERGWVENIFYNSKFHDLAKEEDGLVGMLARLVRDTTPNFVWRTTRPKRTIGGGYGSSTSFSSSSTALDPTVTTTFSTPTYLTFTSKVGLCRSLRKLNWNFNFGDELISPRTYVMSDIHEKAFFLQDYKLTTCLSILRCVSRRAAAGEMMRNSSLDGLRMQANLLPLDQGRGVAPVNELLPCRMSTFALHAHMLMPDNLNFDQLLQKMPLTIKTFNSIDAYTQGLPDDVITAAIFYVVHRIQMQNDFSLKAVLAKRNVSWFREDDWIHLYKWNQFAADTPFSFSHDAAIIEACRSVLLTAAQLEPMSTFDGAKNIWIIKPGAQSRGRGITLSNNIDDVWKTCGFSPQTAPIPPAVTNNTNGSAPNPPAATNSSSASQPIKLSTQCYVLQKYIERPFLIANTKFDIRQWFLVQWHPIRVWIYNDCYLRFSIRYFDLHDFNEAVHLTNNAIQGRYMDTRTNNNHIPSSCMWSRDQFLKYLKFTGIDPCIWHERIFPAIIQYLCQAVETNLSELDVKKQDHYELFGADFMLTSDLRPWLIEINAAPALSPTTSVTDALCTSVLEDSVKVLIDFKQHHNEQACGKFSLVWELNPMEVSDREYTQCCDYRIMDALSIEEWIPAATTTTVVVEKSSSENDDGSQIRTTKKSIHAPSSHYLKSLAHALKQQLASCEARYEQTTENSNGRTAAAAAVKRTIAPVVVKTNAAAKIDTGLNRNSKITSPKSESISGVNDSEALPRLPDATNQPRYVFTNGSTQYDSDCASDDDDAATVHRELLDIMMTRNTNGNANNSSLASASLINAATSSSNGAVATLSAPSRALLQQLHNYTSSSSNDGFSFDRSYKTLSNASNAAVTNNSNLTQMSASQPTLLPSGGGGGDENELRNSPQPASSNKSSSRYSPIILLKPSVVKRAALEHDRAALRKLHRCARQCRSELRERLSTPEQRRKLLQLSNIILPTTTEGDPSSSRTQTPTTTWKSTPPISYAEVETPDNNLVPWELLLKFVQHMQQQQQTFSSANHDQTTTRASSPQTQQLQAYLNKLTPEHDEQHETKHKHANTTSTTDSKSSSFLDTHTKSSFFRSDVTPSNTSTAATTIPPTAVPAAVDNNTKHQQKPLQQTTIHNKTEHNCEVANNIKKVINNNNTLAVSTTGKQASVAATLQPQSNVSVVTVTSPTDGNKKEALSQQQGRLRTTTRRASSLSRKKPVSGNRLVVRMSTAATVKSAATLPKAKQQQPKFATSSKRRPKRARQQQTVDEASSTTVTESQRTRSTTVVVKAPPGDDSNNNDDGNECPPQASSSSKVEHGNSNDQGTNVTIDIQTPSAGKSVEPLTNDEDPAVASECKKRGKTMKSLAPENTNSSKNRKSVVKQAVTHSEEIVTHQTKERLTVAKGSKSVADDSAANKQRRPSHRKSSAKTDLEESVPLIADIARVAFKLDSSQHNANFKPQTVVSHVTAKRAPSLDKSKTFTVLPGSGGGDVVVSRLRTCSTSRKGTTFEKSDRIQPEENLSNFGLIENNGRKANQKINEQHKNPIRPEEKQNGTANAIFDHQAILNVTTDALPSKNFPGRKISSYSGRNATKLLKNIPRDNNKLVKLIADKVCDVGVEETEQQFSSAESDNAETKINERKPVRKSKRTALYRLTLSQHKPANSEDSADVLNHSISDDNDDDDDPSLIHDPLRGSSIESLTRLTTSSISPKHLRSTTNKFMASSGAAELMPIAEHSKESAQRHLSLPATLPSSPPSPDRKSKPRILMKNKPEIEMLANPADLNMITSAYVRKRSGDGMTATGHGRKLHPKAAAVFGPALNIATTKRGYWRLSKSLSVEQNGGDVEATIEVT